MLIKRKRRAGRSMIILLCLSGGEVGNRFPREFTTDILPVMEDRVRENGAVLGVFEKVTVEAQLGTDKGAAAEAAIGPPEADFSERLAVLHFGVVLHGAILIPLCPMDEVTGLE